MSTIPVIVTGLGPVSSIGCGKNEFWQSLSTGKHGFSEITACDVSDSPSKIGAEIKDFQLSKYVRGGNLLADRLPRPVQLALAASALAFKDAGFSRNQFDPDRIGVVVGTSVANMGATISSCDDWKSNGRQIDPEEAFYLFNHSAACLLSAHFDLRGPVHTISCGCNSGIDAVGHAMRTIQAGLADAMLVVGSDSELFPEIISAMNISNSLCTKFNNDPGRASRPFDRDRNGNVIGEGASALLLETESHATARRASGYARIAAHSITGAGRRRRYNHNHPTEDTGPCVRSLQNTLTEAGWHKDDVDVVNANGSSSVIYDRLEAIALDQLFSNKLENVRVHSVKSMLGQHGAGSSALQVAATCLAISEGMVPPTINHEQADSQCPAINVVTKPDPFAAQNVLVNAIGFGGFYYSSAAFTAINA